MAKRKVEVELTQAQELGLMDRFGRRCSPPALVNHAIAEVLRMQGDNVAIFEGAEEYKARIAKEATEIEAEAKTLNALSPAVEELLTRFRAGEKFVDLKGREISELQPADHEGNPENLPLMIQVGGDNSEWHPVSLDELQSADPAERAYDHAIEHQNRTQG